MRTQKFLVAGAAALALTLSACAPNAAAPAPAPGTAGSTGSAAAPADTTPVKVDIIYSKTGPLAAYGETFYEGPRPARTCSACQPSWPSSGPGPQASPTRT